MRVMILENDPRFELKRGDIYSASRYRYDPYEKLSLIEREHDGFDPECNVYTGDVAYWMGPKGEKSWWVIADDNRYVPMEDFYAKPE